MLFQEDFYALEFAAESASTSFSESEINDALHLAVELAECGEDQESIGLVQDHVQAAIRVPAPNSVQQRLLSFVARRHSRVAIQAGEWTRAADWLMTGIQRCHGDNDLPDETPLSYQYVITCAAAVAGSSVLEAEPSQLHRTMDAKALHDLSLAYARLGSVDDSHTRRLDSIAPALRRHVEDHLWQAGEYTKRRRRAETDVLSLLLGSTVAFLNELRRACDQIALERSLPIHRDRAANINRLLSQNKQYLLQGEQGQAAEVHEVLGRQMTLLTQSLGADSAVERRQGLEDFASAITTVSSRLSVGGLIARQLLLRPPSHLLTLAHQQLALLDAAAEPRLSLVQSTLQYPLDRPGEPIVLHLVVANQGTGDAVHTSIELEQVPECQQGDKRELYTCSTPIQPARTQTIDCTICLTHEATSIALPINIRYKNVFGAQLSHRQTLVLQRQGDQPDWDALLESTPYPLNPVRSPDRLHGRDGLLTQLRLLTISGTSSILWGQKRVGKTSIAEVFRRQIDTAGRLPIYIQRGDIAGLSEGQIARAIASRLAAAATEATLEVPDDTWFGPHLTRLTDWISKARADGLGKTRIIIIFDEFDEINPSVYLGERGANFFATIRSLADQDVVWLLVGSERMYNIFARHHATLNKVRPIMVDRVRDMHDVRDMITGPTDGFIKWDDGAVDMVSAVTAGNPYYVHLICDQILTMMYRSKRTFIYRADVNSAIEEIVAPASANHWGHFWEDNAEIDSDAHVRSSARAALFLAGMGVAMHDAEVQVPVTISAITRGCALLEDKETVDTDVIDARKELVQRGVIEEITAAEEVGYRPVVPIFGEFLRRHPHSVVYSQYQYYMKLLMTSSIAPSRTAPVLYQGEDFPVSEDDLVSVSSKLIYRNEPVDAMRIKRWLRQFGDDAAIELAFRLLKSLKERYYFDQFRIGLALDDAFKTIDLVLQQHKTKQDIVAKRITNVIVSYGGESGKSGAEVARRFKTLKGFARCCHVDEAIDIVARLESDKMRRYFVVIVDDFVGSGGTALKQLLTVSNRLRQDERLHAWARGQGRIMFIPLWAFRSGIDLIKSDLGDIISVYSPGLLDDDDRAFSPRSRIFANEKERQYAESVFFRVGQQLIRDHPLGWNNCQSLVVFDSTVPNNTLSALWAGGLVDERHWQPLFSRP